MSPAAIFASALTCALALVVLWLLTRRKKEKPWIQACTCAACGWSGQTSRYAGRCPRCNASIGDQQAKRPR